jgi:hypothetical protein
MVVAPLRTMSENRLTAEGGRLGVEHAVQELQEGEVAPLVVAVGVEVETVPGLGSDVTQPPGVKPSGRLQQDRFSVPQRLAAPPARQSG